MDLRALADARGFNLAKDIAERRARRAPLPRPLQDYAGVYENARLGGMEWRVVGGELESRMGVAYSSAEVFDARQNQLRVSFTGDAEIGEKRAHACHENPPHPGRAIKEDCLAPLGLSVTQGAKGLGVARHTLSRVIKGKAGVSAEMAIRLEKAGWSDAGQWLRMQGAFDLAQARQNESAIKVKRYAAEDLLAGDVDTQTSIKPLTEW